MNRDLLLAAATALAFGLSATGQAATSPSPKPAVTAVAKPAAHPVPHAMPSAHVTPAAHAMPTAHVTMIAHPAAKPTAAPHPAASHRPVAAQSAPQPRGPNGATAKCGDGTYSASKNRVGTCAGHKGVAQWY